MDRHEINPALLQRRVRVAVIGAGGTGSQVVNNLARLHLALLAFGHPGGLQVTLWDDDVVSHANVGRQAFYPCDVDKPKAPTLINRLNLAFNTEWDSEVCRVEPTSRLDAEIVIGCVDNRAARAAILAAATSCSTTYWLDLGNQASDGQAILGEVNPELSIERKMTRLPHAGDLFPELLDASLDRDDDAPSCSLADALEKQSLFINSTMALAACNMLSELFRHGYITYHGEFVNLKTGRTNPLAVDEEAWKRFGYGVTPP